MKRTSLQPKQNGTELSNAMRMRLDDDLDQAEETERFITSTRIIEQNQLHGSRNFVPNLEFFFFCML
jgi:hypothetical protein